MIDDAPAGGEPGEVPFEANELFFSRTDPSGIILFGNSVFQRISHYSWDELLQKPHKIIRHSDMPRCVFWLLWETIKQGKPIGAYVKNRAKDGRHYWVFAIVTPIEGGYLSVRLKPSGPFFEVAKKHYADLLAVEREQGLKPADSAAILIETLAALGFDDYESFMAAALGSELAARDGILRRPQDAMLQQLDHLSCAARTLLAHAGKIDDAYNLSENVPFNFRVLAAQLGQAGAAIAVISTNYSALSNEMRVALGRFTEGARGVFKSINQGYFLSCTARVQREVLEFFAAEPKLESLPREKEVHLLTLQQEEYDKLSYNALTEIAKVARGFRHTCADMNRLAAGLEVMRVMGKVECARHDDNKDRMDELLLDLETFQRALSEALKALGLENQSIQRGSEALIAHRA